MGIIHHHAIVVTAYHSHIGPAHKKANEIFDYVSPVSPQSVNGYRSFIVPPDGSKEGWEESVEGDERRALFLAWMKESEFGYRYSWAEFGYGELGSTIRTDTDEGEDEDQ
jgi:hypothetical protein